MHSGYTEEKENAEITAELLVAILANLPEEVGKIVAIDEINPDGLVVRKDPVFDLAEEIHQGKTAIELAAELGHWSCVHAIVEKRSSGKNDPARFGVALFHLLQATNICKDYRVTLALYLLKNGANPDQTDEKGNSCLHLAIQGARYEIAELLIYFNASLFLENNQKLTPCECAAMNDISEPPGWGNHLKYQSHLKILELILNQEKGERGPEMHARMISKIMQQIRVLYNTNYHEFVVDCLLDPILSEIDKILRKGVAIDWRDEDGNTLLHTASEMAETKLVSMFIVYGFSVNARNKAGLVPDEANWQTLPVFHDFYLRSFAKINLLILLFKQALRDENHGFHKISLPIFMSHIVPYFAYITSNEKAEKIKNTGATIATKRLVHKFDNSSLAQIIMRSAESKEFVDDLRVSLTNKDPAETIGNKARSFLEKKNGKKSTTVALVVEFGLLSYSPFSLEKKREKENNNQLSKHECVTLGKR